MGRQSIRVVWLGAGDHVPTRPSRAARTANRLPTLARRYSHMCCAILHVAGCPFSALLSRKQVITLHKYRRTLLLASTGRAG